MECNKEEALRAKEIAERKMQSKDFVGARKIALKAQQLFPELENISQMLSVCDVHCSAVVKVSGSELDWYGILQVDQTADEASIKRQYRKLALVLHPDKNKFAGAEAAFKLIGEAQRVLTDQAKRSLYDMKRRVNVRTTSTRQAPPHMNKNYNARKQPDNENSFTNHASSEFSGMNQQQMQTFWTICPFCSIRYQYYQNVMNRALRCQNCMKPFIAYNINAQGTQPGANSGHTWNQSAVPPQKEVPNQSAHRAGYQSTSGNSTSMHSQGVRMAESFSKMDSGANFGGRSRSKAAGNGLVPETEAKAESEKLAEAYKRAQNRKRGRKTVIEESSESCDTDSTDEDEVAMEDDLTGQNAETTGSRHYPRRSTRQKQHVRYNENGSDDDDFVNPPNSKKSRRRGLSGGSYNENDKEVSGDAKKTRESAAASAVSKDEKKERKTDGVSFEENFVNGKDQADTYQKHGKQQSEDVKKEESSKDEYSFEEASSVNPGLKIPNPESMTYAEPEFTDFDKDRTARCFAVDQIWAAYDRNGCMPRYYARIRKIFSESKLEVTWLEHDLDYHDEDVRDWVAEDLPVACGVFTNMSNGLEDYSSFSHLASWLKGRVRGTYMIYPRKGDVWAIFKDWNINWSSDPDLHREYKFEFVEVLSDYDDGNGIKVVYLVKLKGFVSLFQRLRNKGLKSFQIPPKEILRFSHKIPFRKMTGKEREDVPEGSYELDPASLPSDIEEVVYVPSKTFDGLVIDVESIEDQTNDPCEKDIQEGKTINNSIPFPRGMNGTCQTKEKNMESGKDDLDGCFGIGKVEPNANKCGAENGMHLETGSNGPEGEGSQYPVAEFYNFEACKSHDKFQIGQIWALYSDVDELPKFYGQIKKVACIDFEVEISWLEACPEGKLGWSSEELPVGCGKFWLSQDTATFDSPMTFSHQVKAGIPSKNRYDIYPSVGHIWAVYKNLRSNWTSKDMKNCEYDLVRVQNNDAGFRVMILEKVDGYNSVFRDAGVEKEIARNQLLKFSHQIPAFRLTGEGDGKLRGFFELDPAAVPPILFQTFSS